MIRSQVFPKYAMMLQLWKWKRSVQLDKCCEHSLWTEGHAESGEQQQSCLVIGTLSVPSATNGSKVDTWHRNSWVTCQIRSVIFMLKQKRDVTCLDVPKCGKTEQPYVRTYHRDIKHSIKCDKMMLIKFSVILYLYHISFCRECTHRRVKDDLKKYILEHQMLVAKTGLTMA